MQSPTRSAFTLIELLVVISIIAVLAALLLPTLRTVKGQAQQMRCASSQRQLAAGIIAYSGDWDGLLPRLKTAREDPTKHKAWFCAIAEYVGHDSDDQGTIMTERSGSVIWGCPLWRPAAPNSAYPGYGMVWYPDAPTSYITNFFWLDPSGGYNGTGVDIALGRISAKARRIMLGDSVNWHLFLGSYAADYSDVWDPYRHNGRAVYSFFDGHVQSVAGTAYAWRGCANPTSSSWNP
jgi:prepilin-type N-terminal cleavage/methylation domain-containing protein/prepilin-type processing-associated H-X9-DG protein